MAGRSFFVCCMLLIFSTVFVFAVQHRRVKRDGFTVTVECSSGYALTALEGDISAYFATDSEISSDIDCTEVPGSVSNETCSSKSRFYLDQSQLEYEHFIIDCFPDKYLQSFKISLADFSGPFLLNYTCCQNSDALIAWSTSCVMAKLDSNMSMTDVIEKSQSFLDAKIISQVQYLRDRTNKDWYVDVNLCSFEKSVNESETETTTSTATITETVSVEETTESVNATTATANETEATTAAANETEATTAAANQTEVTTAAANETEASTAAANETEATTAAANQTEVTTAAANETEASTAAANETESTTSAANVTEATTAAANETEASTASANETEATTAAANQTEVTTAPANETEASTAAANETEATTAAANQTEVTTAAANETEASTAAANETESTTSAANVTEATTAAANETEASTASANETEATTAAANVTDATTAAANETESTTAAANETEATTAAVNQTEAATTVATNETTIGNVTEVENATTATTVAATTSAARICRYKVYKNWTKKAKAVRADTFMKFAVDDFDTCANRCIDHPFCTSFAWIPEDEAEDGWTCEMSHYHSRRKTCYRGKKEITGEVNKVTVVHCYRCEYLSDES